MRVYCISGGVSQEGIFVSACESYVNVYDVCV